MNRTYLEKHFPELVKFKFQVLESKVKLGRFVRTSCSDWFWACKDSDDAHIIYGNFVTPKRTGFNGKPDGGWRILAKGLLGLGLITNEIVDRIDNYIAVEELRKDRLYFALDMKERVQELGFQLTKRQEQQLSRWVDQP